MALRTDSARRTIDRLEDLAAWVLIAAGLLVLLFGLGLWALVRRAAMAANCARWEDEWREVAPNWTHGTHN